MIIDTAEQVVTYAGLNAKANALARAILAGQGETRKAIALWWTTAWKRWRRSSLQSSFQAPTVAQMAIAITESQAKNLDQAALRRILAELESLSDDDAKRLLAD
jgi:hypothetical protein